MNLDIGRLNESLQQATSAFNAAAIAEQLEEQERLSEKIRIQTAQRDATIVAGAEASIDQKALLEKQLEIFEKQNGLLLDNYNKLKELYEEQVKANAEAQIALKQSRRFNGWMLTVAIIAMFAAIAAPIVTVLVSR